MQPLPGGIVKFYRNEEYLDEFLAGKLYCNTPEYYRLHDGEGVSDPNESITASYRPERGDPKPTMHIAGKPISPDRIGRLTVRGTGRKDRWLHCWTRLTVPERLQKQEVCISERISVSVPAVS